MTIYSKLMEMGYTDEQIREAVDKDLNTQTFGLSVNDTVDGWPIVGINYRCDHKAEEEWGVSDMMKNINGQKRQRTKVFLTSTGYVVFKATDGELYESDSTRSHEHFRYTLKYAQGRNTVDRWRMTVKEMREEAKKKGVKLTGLTKRDDIEHALQLDDLSKTAPAHPNRWPGWFQTGKALVLKAETGIVRDVLGLLVRASQADTLGVSSGSQPFSTGFGFYDTADLGPKLKKQIADDTAWYNKQMKHLAPVQKALEAKGHGFIFLGSPSVRQGTTRYWLNGNITKLVACQPFGWYTLDELRTEKFVEDARLKKIEHDKQFDDKGKYRPEYLASLKTKEGMDP